MSYERSLDDTTSRKQIQNQSALSIGGAHQAAVYSHYNHGPINSNGDRTQSLSWLFVIIMLVSLQLFDKAFPTFLICVMYIQIINVDKIINAFTNNF